MSFQYPSLQLGGQGERKWINRRATVRYQCAPATVGKVFAGTREDFLRVWVLDLSKGGAGLLLNRPLPDGQQVMIQIRGANHHVFNIIARVVHTAEHHGGEWMIGLEFLQPLTEDQLDALLS